jgi:hypothetical protein
MKYQANRIVSAIVVLLLGLSASISLAQTPQQALNQYVADLQKNPNDYALREKIIKHVQTMKQKPAIPEEARRHYVKGCTLLDDAKQVSEGADAADEFRRALLLAPWWGDAYMRMGLALETAQRYDEAIASLKLFMATNPQSDVLRKAQDEIYKIEAKKDKKAKSAQPPAPPEKKKLTDEELIRSLDGARYSGQTRDWDTPPAYVWENEFVIRGGNLSWRQCIIEYGPRSVRELPLGSCYTPYGNAGRMRIEGRVAKQILDGGMVGNTFTISEDGNSISHKWGPNTFIFYRR